MSAPRASATKVAPLVAAVALLGAVGTVGAVGVLTRDDAGAGGPATTVVATAAPTVPTTSTTLPPTTTTIPKTTLSQPLGKGMMGDEVKALQQRLADLGFQPGPIDGQFGSLTQMSVWAYQKLVMGAGYRDPDGVVTPQMWLDLQDPLPVHARRPDAGRHVEIYLPQQVLVTFDGDTPVFISHIASGELEAPGDDFNKGKEWCEEVTIDPGELGNETGTEPLKKGVCGNSWTPGGSYKVTRKVEGTRESRLGGMLNPVYFNYGIAIHGGYNVPLHPASHGCIRIPNAISEAFFGLMEKGDRVLVWDGVKEPEDYGAQSGLWDWADPDYTTTTSTTTTTTPPTTVTPTTRPAPTTVAPPPVVTPPVTTTTTPAPPASPPAG